MAFKVVLFVALCLAQGFGYQPLDAARGNDCNSPDVVIPEAFEETIYELDEVREEVSVAAMEAEAYKGNTKVIIACFAKEGVEYVRLGRRLGEMMRSASKEITQTLQEKSEKYAKLAAGPMKAITVTLMTAPEAVYKHLKNREYLKAFMVMTKAEKIVLENSIKLGKIVREFATEVPEMANRFEQLGREIHQTARSGSQAIREAYRQCIAEGGPKNTFASSEEDESSQE